MALHYNSLLCIEDAELGQGWKGASPSHAVRNGGGEVQVVGLQLRDAPLERLVQACVNRAWPAGSDRLAVDGDDRY